VTTKHDAGFYTWIHAPVALHWLRLTLSLIAGRGLRTPGGHVGIGDSITAHYTRMCQSAHAAAALQTCSIRIAFVGAGGFIQASALFDADLALGDTLLRTAGHVSATSFCDTSAHD
jgi:hypothetical protein